MLKNSRRTRGQTQVIRQKTLKNIIVQLVTTCVIALLVSFKSWEWSYSAFLGGLIFLIPYTYVANRILKKDTHTVAEQSANQTLADLYIGQIWKMVIGAMLFALVFVLVKPLSPFPLFGTYIAIEALGWYLQMKADKRFIKL